MTLRRLATVGALTGLVSIAVRPAAAYPRPGRTEVVSVREDGTAAGGLLGAAISDDGRYVAFWTSANLDPRDTPGSNDVYVRDRVSGTTEWASSGPGWTLLFHNSIAGPAISADGRYVAYSTFAPAAAGDTDALTDVFLRDLASDTTELVSPADDDANHGDPDVSADGRYVSFSGGSLTSPSRVFLKDREIGTTEVVSVNDDGQPLSGNSFSASVSADAHALAFVNQATPASGFDVYVRDRATRTTERLAGGAPPLPFSTWGAGEPAISDDGRHVAFLSAAPDLVPRDTNLATDVFVHDRATGTSERVSVSSSGTEAAGTTGPSSACLTGGSGFAVNPHAPPSSSFFVSLSGDGRYVAFVSLSDNLVPGDTNGCYDVFVHDRAVRTSERVSVTGSGGQAVRAGFYTPSLTRGGEDVAFVHFSDLVPEDTNRGTDVYVRSRGPATGIGALDVAASGQAVVASGWATFTGAVLAQATDPSGDAGASVGADLLSAAIVDRHEQEDLLVRLALASVPPAGTAGVFYGMRFSVGGTAYVARMADAGGELQRCMPGCTAVATLSGSVGTTGHEVLIAIPQGLVGAGDGTPLAAIQAFTEHAVAGTLDTAALPSTVVPAASVRLGVAAAGTDEADVDFVTVATASRGAFSGTMDVSGLEPGEYDVWARACLREVCGTERGGIHLPGQG